MEKNVSDFCSSIRIAVIAYALRAAGGLSVGQNLVSAFSRVAPEHHYFITVPPGDDYEEICSKFPTKTIEQYAGGGNPITRWRYDRFALPKTMNAFRPDIVLCLGNTGLSGIEAPQAILCQDAHLFYPVRYYSKEIPLRKLTKYYQKRRLRNNLRNAQNAAAQSERNALDRSDSAAAESADRRL